MVVQAGQAYLMPGLVLSLQSRKTVTSANQAAAMTHLFVEQDHVLRRGLVSLDQLDGHFVASIHQGLVHDAKATLSQAALLALRIATDRDVVPAGWGGAHLMLCII